MTEQIQMVPDNPNTVIIGAPVYTHELTFSWWIETKFMLDRAPNVWHRFWLRVFFGVLIRKI